MSCFGGRDEQIYLVELTVERLRLTADKYREELADCPPVVKLKFIDFPVFVIGRRDDELADPPLPPAADYDESQGLTYACGKSCLFVRRPRDLVTAMQAQPLRIGVFRPGETYPLAEGTVPLSGCLCDQVAMSGNDREHRPRPYQLEGNYDLAQPGGNPAGAARIFWLCEVSDLCFIVIFVMSIRKIIVWEDLFETLLLDSLVIVWDILYICMFGNG